LWHTRHMLESLERRYLLSASLDPATGVLSVAGTEQADRIVLTQSGNVLTVDVNGARSTFDAAKVAQVSVQGLGGDDFISLAASVTAPATVDGGAGNDTILGGGGPESLIGGDGNDSIVAGAGNDTLEGDAGDDTLRGGAGSDILLGGPGNDLLYAGTGKNNILLGGPGDDTLHGGLGGGDFLDGGDGNDLLIGGLGDETLIGGAGDDTLQGGDGNQLLLGEEGNDLLIGGKGNQSLSGGIGDDTLYGGTGQQTLDGGDGNDLLYAGTGNQLLYGGPGDDRLVGGNGNDTMYGGDGNDTLIAGSGNNQMYGELGDDLLIGGPGNNYMSGGPGNDIFVNGGGGRDTVDGGPGFDTYESDPNDLILNCEYDYNPLPAKPGAPAPPVPAPAAASRPIASRGRTPGTRTAAAVTPTVSSGNPYLDAAAAPIGAAPAAYIAPGGLLVVLGTVSNDTMNLRQIGPNIVVNVNGHSLGVYNAAQLPLGVAVNGGPGSDDIELENPDGSQAVTTFAFLDGGDGNDTIRGGGGVDFFYMGGAPSGNKVLIGAGIDNAFDFSHRATNVRVALDGSPSGEYLRGENDRIFCSNNAVIYGGAGNDTLFATYGANVRIFGDGGSNTIYGAYGPFSTFVGGPGNDTVFGGSGIDTIYLRNGQRDFFSRGPNRHTIVVGDPRLDYDLDRHKYYPQ